MDDAFPGKSCYSFIVNPQPQQSKKCCIICGSEVGEEGFSAKRSKLSKVVSCNCNMSLCKKHQLKLCLKCDVNDSAVVGVVTQPLPKHRSMVEDHGALEARELFRTWTRGPRNRKSPTSSSL